jgi:hypothetical protein
VPGKDIFIGYQDARAFLSAAYELWLRGRSAESLDASAHSAFDKLLNEVFATLDPSDPNRRVPVAKVKSLIEQAERGLTQ